MQKALDGVKQVIMDVKKDVIEQNGAMYHIETIEQFNECLGKETHKHVLKLNNDIEKVIAKIMQGDQNDSGDVTYSTPILEVKLEDPELEDNVDLFI